MISFRSLLSRLSPNYQNLSTHRLRSAWIKASSAKSGELDNVDVEELFIDDRVQTLLQKLTGLDDEKIFAERSIEHAERSHFALMTDSMLEEAKAQMRERGKKLLQFVPVKEPRKETFSILSRDPEIEGFDTAKFVFTDITFDATNQDRTVVIREPDGTLRTALPEERDRMNRVFYEKPNRPIFTPAVFKDPDLQRALDADRHEFVMDFACWYYEPDDPEFVRLSHTVFDRTVEKNKFSILHSTRHFGAFTFYLVLNNNIPPLLNFYGSIRSLHDAANLIRLQKIVFPNWKSEISFQDSDEKIVRDFISQNRRLKESLPDLMKLLAEPSFRKWIPEDQKLFQERKQKFQAPINRENIRTAEGPLGELSSEYKLCNSLWIRVPEILPLMPRLRRRTDATPPKAGDAEDKFADEVTKYHKRLTRDGGEGIWENLRGKLFYPLPSLDTTEVLSSNFIIKMLTSIRIASGFYTIMNDCDEIYNYWEQLHLMLFGRGFQTWEYSPTYAIRSWFYIYLYYIPASLLTLGFQDSKVALFYTFRVLLGFFHGIAEYILYYAIANRLGNNIAKVFFMINLFSIGVFYAGSAFLPSSFSMILNMLSTAFWLKEKWNLAIFFTAFSALVGWPFAGILGLPIFVEMVLIRRGEFIKKFFKAAILSGIVIGAILYTYDSHYYGKTVIAPLNIVLYNVISGHGPELYGVEPFTYYLKNLFLNWNIGIIFASLAIPLALFAYVKSSYNYELNDKNELKKIFPKIHYWTYLFVVIFGILSASRGYIMFKNYHGIQDTHKMFYDHFVIPQASERDFTNMQNPIRVCVGKEWHRFPSSFFLPEATYDKFGEKRQVELEFIKSEFKGLLPKHYPKRSSLLEVTKEIPTEMNDANKEEPSRYVPVDSCDFLIDLDDGTDGAKDEPNYSKI